MNSANNLEDLGIYQDGDQSIGADSVPVEDFSLNISMTDDDDEQNVFANNWDVTFDEDDISIAGQSIADVGSLTEFEEVEQKIRRNRVVTDDDDSDDNTDDNTDISDIPTDMENRKAAGSHTASSAASSRQPSFEHKSKPTIAKRQNNTSSSTLTRRPSSSITSISPPSPATKLPTTGSSTTTVGDLKRRQLQDTGYQSAVGSPISKVQPQPPRPPTSQAGIPLRDQRSSPSSNDGVRSNTSSNDLTAVSTDIPLSDIHDRQMNESGEPNSMVATFGTTEDFERLLKQQLVDDESNGEQFEPFHLQSESSSDNEKEKTKENSPPPKAISKPSPKERTSKLPMKSARLSSTLPSTRNKTPPQKAIKPKTNPATRKSSFKGGKPDDNHVRSPAANRARNARNMRSAIYPLTRESSGEDLSVRSDASSSELKYRLKSERRTGKEQAELLKHLQENYSDLLMKFADAENTIDKLRLGAKIDLAVSLPHAIEDFSLPTHQATMRRTGSNVSAATISSDRTNQSSRPSSATTSSILRHSQSNPQLSSTPAEALESSLKLPMSAKSELYKIGLRYQAKDLQNKIDSLATLLHETDLPKDEREAAMGNVEDAMTSLEDDYDAAVGKHEDERHQLSLIHGVDRVEREIPAFDQGGTMDKEIKGLGDMVKALRDTISRINAQEDAWNDEKKKQQQKRIKPNHQIPKDKKKELEEKFQQLLNKHNASNDDDGHTTATSIPYTPSEDDDVTIRSERAVPNIYMAPADSFNDDSMFTASQTSQSTVISTPYSGRRPKLQSRTSSVNSSFTSVTSATPSVKQPTTPVKPIPVRPTPVKSTSPSRIPRLINSSPVKLKKLTVTNAPPGDKGTDSGFVGSESSRQSIASPMTSTRSKPSVTVTSPSSKQPTTSSVTSSKRTSRPTEKRRARKPETTGKKQPTVTTNNNNQKTNRKLIQPQPKDESTADDVSTTSTVRGLMDTQPSVTSSDASTVRRRISKENKQPPDGARAANGGVDDSALQTIRGEIERLRDEIKKQQQAREEEEEKERQKKQKEKEEEEEKERERLEQEKKAEREREEREREEREKEEREREEKNNATEDVFRPLRVSTPVNSNNGSSTATSDNETLRIIKDDIKALKNEMRRQSRPGRQSRRRLSLASDSDTSVATSVIYQSRDHRRSRSLTRGGGESQLNVPQRPPQLVAPAQPPVGYWTYVPDAPVWTTAPMGRRYVPRMMATNPQPPVYGTTTKSLLGGANTQPSKPNLSVFISPRSPHGGAVDGDVIKKADVYIVDPSFRNSQQQQQIRRSSSMTRLNHGDDDVIIMDSPLMTSSTRLNTSLDRAVRSAQLLRDKTRRMYSHVRDDVDRSQLFADTF